MSHIIQRDCRLAYVIGVALGDGNLSCPNGRATRLRITCDSNYPALASEIQTSLQYLFPVNKVSVVLGPIDSYFNISVYSNKLNDVLPWKVGCGSKQAQHAHVPDWILNDDEMTKACLRGLIQTDGSIYEDRGYKMVNFTNVSEALADNVYNMMIQLGYRPHKYKAKQRTGNYKFTIRLSRKVEAFVSELHLHKA